MVMTQVRMVSGSGAGDWWEIIDSAFDKGPEVRGQYSTRKSSAGPESQGNTGK